MATSGSTNYSLTAQQIVNQALYLLNVVPEGDTPPSADSAGALTSLELMLKTWGAAGRLWLTASTTQALTASTASYTLSAGTYRVLSVRRRTSSIDTPLFPLSRDEYDELPNKSGAGMPVNWYQDNQRATTVLYVWLVPDATIAASTTLYLTYARIIEDLDSLSNDPDVPQEWLETLVYNLAAIRGPKYGLAGDPNFKEIRDRAAGLYGALASIDQESTSVYLQPA